MLRATLAILLACLLSGCTETSPHFVSLDSVDRVPAHTHEMQVAHAHGDAPDHEAPQTPAANRTAGTPAGNVTQPGGAGDADNTTSPYDDPDVIVAVLDNGIELDHEAFAEGQVVAWYDFGRDGRPAGVPSITWDPVVEPYARNDHGPATASMVGGGGPDQTASHARGVALAIGQVAFNDGGYTYWKDMTDAIRWAVDTVGADVLSISKYTYVPGTADAGFMEALEYARSKDVLPVVLAGNGHLVDTPEGRYKLPTLSWLHTPAASPHALIVGGAFNDGTPTAPEYSSMDPEVTARYWATVACAGASDCYRSTSGTSYSTPLVAGMAATMLQHAHDLDMPLDAERTEDILKGCAQGTDAPTLEGYGFLDAAGLDCALQHVAAGTTPEVDLVDRVYVDGVQDAERRVWSGEAPGS